MTADSQLSTSISTPPMDAEGSGREVIFENHTISANGKNTGDLL
jgi:hypothetical protein